MRPLLPPLKAGAELLTGACVIGTSAPAAALDPIGA